MMILALESSAKSASAAVCSDSQLLGMCFQNNGLTHSRTLLAMVESLLKNLDLSTSDIDLVAVSRGPGSFTGVRIGVSAAKGLAWGIEKPVCGVSTLEAMAYQYTETDVLICPVMDARRNQVYNALFLWQDGVLVRQCEDRAISLEDLAKELSDQSTQPSPPNSAFCILHSAFTAQSAPPQIILIGDGAQLTCDYLGAAGIACGMPPELIRHQTAYGVALAALKGKHIPAIDLEPSYLRPSQAERERTNAQRIP